MKTKKLDRGDWGAYFDQLSKILEGKRATIEVASLDIGNQVEAENILLYGITYDHKDNLIEVSLDGLDHMIPNPHDVEVVYGDEGVETIGVIDGDGRQQIVKLSDPLMLPSSE